MERHKITDWEEYYRENELETMPWYREGLDHDFNDKIKELNITSGMVLDLGSGPGTQSIALAKMGFKVTGIDISETAVKKANEKAKNEGLAINFLHDDILNIHITENFDLILDRGCFHVLDPLDRQKYVNNINKLLNQNAYLLLKCFSDKEPGSEGPHRVSHNDINKHFDRRLKIISIVDSIFIGNHKPPPKALFCTIQNK